MIKNIEINDNIFKINKGWGYEILLCNNNNYNGKILNFDSNSKTSMHYHIKKNKTLYVKKGNFNLLYIDPLTADINENKLIENQSIEIPSGLIHQLHTENGGEIIEISDHNDNNDVIRVLKGDSQSNKYLNYFNIDYLDFLFPQRSRLTTEYQLNKESNLNKIISSINIMIEKDYKLIKDYLPKNCESILDIGCGLALSNIPIYKKYKKCEINLLDKTDYKNEEERNDFSNKNKKGHGFHEDYFFYNSMSAAFNTLVDNGVSKNDINLYEVGKHNELFTKKYDIITSILSCGWHYSIETYVKLMSKTLKQNGIIIIDIRHSEINQLEIVKKYFNIYKNIYNLNESKHTGGNLGNRYILTLK